MSSTSSMASAISNSKYICQSSSPSINRQPHFHNIYISCNSVSRSSNFCASICNHQPGPAPFYQWHGLRHLGISNSQHFVRLEKKRGGKGKGVFASLFGVGAPEALVIGVVALLVFGPKGLAEAARTLGKTLRSFQPTIRELQDVSREFKSTLEREIGLDEIQNPIQNNFSSSTTQTESSPTISISEDSQMKVDPNGSPSTNNAYSSEDYLKITEEQLKAAAAQQLMQTSPGENQSETEASSEGTIDEVAAVVPPPPPEKPKSET